MSLINVKSLPKWYGHNDFILNSYRSPNQSFKVCLQSVFRLHNESGNISTHIMGFLLFAILFIHTMACNSFKKFDSTDKLIFSVYFVAILTCYTMSSLFHTFQCHSRQAFKFFAKYLCQ
ncbi:unnamed protein product [Medioppia subpectinata]|uniref:Uncharacterized protein n=1 Tax=Medioppia subpectinata TaxID=1979941 RepID=A0A7R9PX90_9ACAR|nr:unnamed protein product [Medioppia subpectinata]CAG2104761.1 unnamed protein product [Medioppia subpectinata]